MQKRKKNYFTLLDESKIIELHDLVLGSKCSSIAYCILLLLQKTLQPTRTAQLAAPRARAAHPAPPRPPPLPAPPPAPPGSTPRSTPNSRTPRTQTPTSTRATTSTKTRNETPQPTSASERKKHERSSRVPKCSNSNPHLT